MSYFGRAFLLALALILACGKTETPSPPSAAAGGARAPLQVEILALDAPISPRGERPFIAGERALLTLKVHGGTPPYSLQLQTSKGNPRLASGWAELEAELANIETALEFVLHSEVESGSYGLALRVSDADGRGQVARSEPFEVLGKDAPLAEHLANPLALKLVDIAGRERASFYQGEEIHVRVELSAPGSLAIAIIAADEREFMPTRRYQVEDTLFDIPLVVPRLARVGNYRVDVATDDAQASAPLPIVGRSFAPIDALALSELTLQGGQNLRAPRGGLLKRGETIRVEALAGGIKTHAEAELRLRDRASKIVSRTSFERITPADLHPTARALLSTLWTPDEALLPGRYTLELELSEGDKVTALYREIELGDETMKGLSGKSKLLHAEPEVDE